MSAQVYHFCQHERKMLYLPSHNGYKSLPVGTVLTECPSCHKPMKAVTITERNGGYNRRTGWGTSGNYKKKQQAKSRAGNIESEQQRAARYAKSRPYCPSAIASNRAVPLCRPRAPAPPLPSITF